MPTIGSKTSTTEHPTSAKTRTVTIPRIPQDIVDEILDYLAADCILSTLRACALVSKSWVTSCRRHLFHSALFTARNMHRWFRVFPVPEESPAHLVKELRVWIAGQDWVPERFFEYTSCFTNTERVHLLGYGGAPPLRVPSLWKLPQSVTSLVINSGVVTLTQIRDIMAQLPNLDDLSLMGSLIRMDNGAFAGIGTVLTGRFSGKLLLRGECADKSVLNMLSEVPTGLRFTEVDISCTGKCLLSTVQLVRACGRNLVKLSCTVCIYNNYVEAYESSFDFSKLPNLQEVKLRFKAGRAGGGLRWIPMALSTLRLTTSPHLTTVHLYFARLLISNRSVASLIEDTADDLRRVADEVARIEHEFEGAVNPIVDQDPAFKGVLDTLKILQHCGR